MKSIIQVRRYLADRSGIYEGDICLRMDCLGCGNCWGEHDRRPQDYCPLCGCHDVKYTDETSGCSWEKPAVNIDKVYN